MLATKHIRTARNARHKASRSVVLLGCCSWHSCTSPVGRFGKRPTRVERLDWPRFGAVVCRQFPPFPIDFCYPHAALRIIILLQLCSPVSRRPPACSGGQRVASPSDGGGRRRRYPFLTVWVWGSVFGLWASYDNTVHWTLRARPVQPDTSWTRNKSPMIIFPTRNRDEKEEFKGSLRQSEQSSGERPATRGCFTAGGHSGTWGF